MKTITRESLSPEAKEALTNQLEELASTGDAIIGTTPGQTWAINKLVQDGVSLDDLVDQEQAPHFNQLITEAEQQARDAFFDVAPDDAEAMVRHAYDERFPMFLRGPILETLREGMSEFYPSLKPTGVNDEGQPMYNLADLAKALGASEDELLAMADEKGIRDKLHTGPVQPIH